MAWSFNPFTGNLDLSGSSGGESYIDGEVEYHSNLGVAVGSPAVNSAFLVRKGEGLYFISRKPAGIWVRELNNGNLDDWKYAGTFSDLYRDANFRILNNADVSKELAFDLSGISTGTTRTLTAPNASGVIVLGNDSRIANIRASSVNNLNGQSSQEWAGGVGGIIAMNGGASDSEFSGSNAGSIFTHAVRYRAGGTIRTNAGDFDISAGGAGGSIDLSGGTGSSVTPSDESDEDGFGGSGGSINLRGGDGGEVSNGGHAGSIDMGGENAGPTIGNSGGRNSGSISTRGTGSIGLGYEGIRTTLTGTATADRAISLPNASGTIALNETFAAPPAIGNTTRSTGAFTTLSAAPTSGSALTLTGGTVTASAPLIDATQTWNASGTTFTGLRVNVTNTASASASLLADFQVGGTNVLSINRAGALGAAGNAWLAFSSTFGSAASLGGVWGFGGLAFNVQSSLGGSSGVIQLGSNMSMGWSSNTAPTAANADLRLFRDAADTLAQYRGTNAQTFRIYNTFTDASNYERGFMRWSSNILQIGSEKLGTGTARNLQFVIDGVNMLEFQAGGSIVANRSILTAGGYGITSDLHFTLQAATGQLRWGGTSSVPMLKRSSAIIQARLGDDSAYTTIDAQHRLQGTAPATAGATGTAGDIRYDADYIYVATATNTWKRAAIATW
jgi:hypothetical protein